MNEKQIHRWLMSRTGHDKADERYARWLQSAGMTFEWASAGGGYPEIQGALLLTGGGDVDPGRYGETPAPETSLVDRLRDEFEILLIREFIRAGLPVFGICRGLQILGVALGGRLIQHVPAVETIEVHGQVDGLDSQHGIAWVGEGTLARRFRLAGQVNSAHHQALHPDGIGIGLAVAARSRAGVIEAVEGAGFAAPVVGVQWHPERLPREHPASRELLQWMKELV